MDCYFRGFGVSTTLIRVFITIVSPLIVMLCSVLFFCIFYAIKEGTKLFTDKENAMVFILFFNMKIKIYFKEIKKCNCHHLISYHLCFPSLDCCSFILTFLVLKSW